MATYIIKLQLIALMLIGAFPELNFPTQEVFEKNVELKKGQKVKLELKFADEINIKTWDKPELYIKVRVEHNFKEKLEFELLEFNASNEVEIEEKVKNLENRKHINMNGNHHDGDCIELDIDYEVYLPANVELSVNSISGNIDVKKMNSSLNLETISGFIDAAIDPSKGYNLKCSTISGSIYSDLKFETNKKIKADIVGSKLNTSINGGGKQLKLKTISGDVYLRKR